MGPTNANPRGFKKMLSPAKQHQFRNEATIQIRKTKKDEMLKRRRNQEVEHPVGSTTKGEVVSVDVGSKKVRLTSPEETVDVLMKQFGRLSSDVTTRVNEAATLEVLREVRRVVSTDDNTPYITKFLAHGLLAHLYRKILTETNENILFEIAWILVNVTSSKVSGHVEAVSTSGIVPYIINLFMHTNAGVQEQAVWIIANLAGDRAEYRNTLLEMNTVMNGLLHNFETPGNPSHMSTCAWAMSNLFQHLPPEKLHLVVPFIPKLCQFLQVGVRSRVKPTDLSDLLAAMLHIVENGVEFISLFCQTGISSTVAESIRYYMNVPNSTTMLNYAIRVLGNIASGTEEQTELVVQSGFLQVAESLLHPSKERIIQRSALFCLSNIGAGSPQQIDTLMSRKLMKRIVSMADISPSEVKKEAIWTLTNIITKGTLEHAERTVSVGSIPVLCNFLRTPYDVQLVLMVLEAIEKLLEYNQSASLGYQNLVEYCNGLDAIEDLQSVQNDEVYEKACKIIVTFFDGVEEDIDDNQNIAPKISEETATYAFGTAATTSLPRKQLFPDTVETKHAGSIGNPFTGSTTSFGGSSQMNQTFR